MRIIIGFCRVRRKEGEKDGQFKTIQVLFFAFFTISDLVNRGVPTAREAFVFLGLP